MSYSFYLFDAGDSDDLLASAHAWLDEQERAVMDGTQARDRPPWADKLVALLTRRHGELQAEGVLAGTSLAPHAQLADSATGVQVRVFGSSVALSVPFWHDGPAAHQAIDRVAGYLATIRQATGFVVYDPQQDAVLDLEAGLTGVLQRYTRGRQTMRQVAERSMRSSRAGRRRGKAEAPRVEERLRDPAAFEAWLADMDGAYQKLIALLPGEVAGQLDYTPGSLAALEQWILARYARVDQVFAAEEARLHEYLARYVGETIRRNAGGAWQIRFDDPRNAYYGVPTIRTGKGSIVAPKYLVSASVDRRTGRYLNIVAHNLIGDEPPRNPNV